MASAGGAPGRERPLRIATYNIHRARGRDGLLDPARTAAVIRLLAADVVALQEVEMPPAPSATTPLLAALGGLGYGMVKGPTLFGAGVDYGNLLLTRLPLMTATLRDLSHPGREPRQLVDARLGLTDSAGQSSGVSLRCLATHLGLDATERRGQIAALAAQVDRHLAAGAGPLLLIGDFNEWWHRSRRLEPLDRRLHAVPIRRTFPARWPLLALDRIWYSRGLELTEVAVPGTSTSREASDHLALVAEFRIAETRGAMTE